MKEKHKVHWEHRTWRLMQAKGLGELLEELRMKLTPEGPFKRDGI